MELTAQELKLIEPGIYRTTIPTVHGLPLEPGQSISSDNTLVEMLRKVKSRTIQHPTQEGVEYPCFFSSPDDFLDTWISGYTNFKNSDASHLDRRQKGFELYYTNWHPEQEMFDKAGLGYPPAIMLATDTNNPYFGEGYMNIGINDLVNERHLVWKGTPMHEVLRIPDREKAYSIDKIMKMEKELHEGQLTILWMIKNTFPLGSPNELKATGNQWTLIGYDPSQVYAGFGRLKFNFPAVSHSQS